MWILYMQWYCLPIFFQLLCLWSATWQPDAPSVFPMIWQFSLSAFSMSNCAHLLSVLCYYNKYDTFPCTHLDLIAWNNMVAMIRLCSSPKFYCSFWNTTAIYSRRIWEAGESICCLRIISSNPKTGSVYLSLIAGWHFTVKSRYPIWSPIYCCLICSYFITIPLA